MTSISETLTKELEIMSLTEISRDDAVQPCTSTPTSSGTLPPPPPPPPLPPKPVRSLPCKPRTRERRIDDTVPTHSATKSSPPAMHPDVASKQGDGIEKKPKKPKSGNPLKKIFSKK